MTPILIKSFRTDADTDGHLFVTAKPGRIVSASATATDPIIGVSDSMGAKAGGMLDTVQLGWSELRLGGAVSFGDPLSSDAAGHGIVAPAGARIGAFAMDDGEEGDIIPVYVALSKNPA